MSDGLPVEHPVLQAVLAGTFTWGLTALGAAAVFLSRRISRRGLDGALGFTAGVMIAASFWSLLAPAIDLAGRMGMIKWLPALVGFLAGAGALRLVDRVLPHVHLFAPLSEAEGLPTRWRRSILLVLAITLHNIPEGLAVGVAFGAASAGIGDGGLGAAIALTLGIGLQNFPEGMAVSIPLRNEGLSRSKSFFYGQLSAVVEPIAAVVGAAVVVLARPLLPYALAFAAGAMFFVVVEEVIPEAQRGGNADLATLSAVTGFTVMMTLDVALG
ncbi:MAG: ZIP family metal transporter [Acidobacteria bacterium]|nr:ZIP family metal transporter [Acidobacteriota bacterium]NIM60146.1 ZIP family metal transporter [Acidobacteriota bacterium]NIO57815.1 ZIP family metal transporter [Acidobacteriota bacterium]NIQ28824.1 ZIP family metal transporter [Acidobacteriota bacterium]NIQ83282.1 ZIP family metal transporter [Acidobacteriota bacterium]